MNQCTFTGNIGKDIELKQTTGGTAICNISVAVSDRVKISGEWKDQTEWVSAVVFGAQAENAAKYLAKGSKVLIQGRMQTRKWQDKDGKDRYSTEIVCDKVEYLSKRTDDAAGADEDIPF